MRTMDTETQTQIQTKEEALDRRFVFHPFTKLDQHPSSDAPVIVSGQRLDAHRQPRPHVPRRDGRPLVRQRRLRPPRDRRGPARRGAAARLLPRVLVDGDRPAGRARRARARACTRRRCRRSSSATAAPTRTTRRSSSSGTTTTSSGAREKKKIISRDRGYHGVTVVSASLTGLKSLHDGFDLPLPMVRHTKAPYSLWERQAGESDEAFAQRLADELEQLILAEGPDTVAAFIGEPLQGAGGVIPPPEGYWARIQEVLRKLRRAADLRRGDHRLRPARQGHSAPRCTASSRTSRPSPRASPPRTSRCRAASSRSRSGACSSRAARRLGPFGHGYTYTAHPLAAAAALANLDVLENDAPRRAGGRPRRPSASPPPRGLRRPPDRGRGSRHAVTSPPSSSSRRQDPLKRFEPAQQGRACACTAAHSSSG